MLSPRVAASIAILFGGGLGALIAVLAVRAEQPGARPTPEPSEEPPRPDGIGPPDAPVRAQPSAPVPAKVASPTGAAAAGTEADSGAPKPDAGAVGSSTTAARRGGPPDLVAVLFTPITDSEQRSRAEVDCANGSGGACQRLAMTQEAAGHDDANTADAMRYQRLATGFFVRACRGSDAVACYALAELRATGRGMKRSETHARALIERAQMLCRIYVQQPVCASLPPNAATEGRKD
jgi:hypothetical protein